MNKLNVFKYGYIRSFRFIFHNIWQFFRNLKYAWQRATKGYCDCDRWDLDQFYSRLFYNSLSEFAERTNSYYDANGMTYKDWQNTIKNMAERFKAIADQQENSSFITPDELVKEKDEAFELLKKWYFHLWD